MDKPRLAKQEPDDREFVQSLARGLSVIQAFGPERSAPSLSEVARATGLSRAAARRFLLTLERLGYVAVEGKRFSLRPRVLNLGYAYLSSMAWWEVAQPHMEEVAAQVHESCSASVLEGHDLIYVARVPTRRILSIGLSIGSHLPAHSTSMGRVLLSGLPEDALDEFLREASLTRHTERTVTDPARLRRIIAKTAKNGWTLVDQELELGMRSIAVPIWGVNRRLIAALNISTHVARMTADQMVEQLLPVLRDASRRISAAMGASQNKQP